jgi:hypothetical protein
MIKLQAATWLLATAPSPAQKQMLKRAGYEIEQIEEGGSWGGLYRWVNAKLDTFQEADPCATEEEAWRDAWATFSDN